METLPLSTQTTQPAVHSASTSNLRETAEKLEASFLSEMLKSAGLGSQPNSLSGGIGEDQFASFHRQALADAMVKSGGIGLAEVFYNSMMEKKND